MYKVQHHSGVIFQFVAFIKKRKRTAPDIIAAGGRYDHLVGFKVNHQHFKSKIMTQYMSQSCWYMSHLFCLFLCFCLDPGIPRTSFHCAGPQRSGGQHCSGQSLWCHGQYGGTSERDRHIKAQKSEIPNYCNGGAAGRVSYLMIPFCSRRLPWCHF